MRETRNAQASIFDFSVEHEQGKQLSDLSVLLDAYSDVLDSIAQDVVNLNCTSTCACGLSVESS